jgi:DNA-binding Xre family transcriptional regulator
MISGAQIRAARALLGMSGTELSELAGVGWSTVQRFETNDEIPASKAGTLERIKNALEARGVVFLGDPVNSPGVQLSPKDASSAKARAKR